MASEVLGTFYDSGVAVELLERLKREFPADDRLHRCVDRALNTFRPGEEKADNGLDPVTAQRAFEAFMQIETEPELHIAVVREPLLSSPAFLSLLSMQIDQFPVEVAEDIKRKIDDLLALANNPAQLALDAIMFSPNLENCAKLVAHHPLLGDKAFLAELSKLAERMEADAGAHLRMAIKKISK